MGHVGWLGRSPSYQNLPLQLHKTTGTSAVDRRRGGRAGKGGRPGEREISRNRDFSNFLKLLTGLRGVTGGTQDTRAASETPFKCPVYATMSSGTAWTNITIYNLKQLNQSRSLGRGGRRGPTGLLALEAARLLHLVEISLSLGRAADCPIQRSLEDP